MACPFRTPQELRGFIDAVREMLETDVMKMVEEARERLKALRYLYVWDLPIGESVYQRLAATLSTIAGLTRSIAGISAAESLIQQVASTTPIVLTGEDAAKLLLLMLAEGIPIRVGSTVIRSIRDLFAIIHSGGVGPFVLIIPAGLAAQLIGAAHGKGGGGGGPGGGGGGGPPGGGAGGIYPALEGLKLPPVVAKKLKEINISLEEAIEELKRVLKGVYIYPETEAARAQGGAAAGTEAGTETSEKVSEVQMKAGGGAQTMPPIGRVPGGAGVPSGVQIAVPMIPGLPLLAGAGIASAKVIEEVRY